MQAGSMLSNRLLGIKCYQFISNDEAINLHSLKSFRHDIWPFRHMARMTDSIDTKPILFSSPPVYWKRPLGLPCIAWMKIIDNDLDSHKLTWTEAVILAQNRPLWRLLATSAAMHSYRCMPKTMMTMHWLMFEGSDVPTCKMGFFRRHSWCHQWLTWILQDSNPSL